MSISILTFVGYLSIQSAHYYKFHDLQFDERNLIGERTLQFIEIMGSDGNKCSSPEKYRLERNEIT